MGKRLIALLALLNGFAKPSAGEEPAPSDRSESKYNMVLPTFGGKQVWADELFFGKWRIQRNALTGHCRLLDDRNYRRTWGTFEACMEALDRAKKEDGLPEMTGKAVILMHGLFRTSASMSKMAAHLEQAGYTVFSMGYPSTRAELDVHAQSLAKVLANLEGIEEINFVAHSLGNLVIRRYLAEAKTSGGPDSRIARIVMLAPPNNGASLAELFANNLAFDMIAGKAAQSISTDWTGLSERLATPECEFAVIAGGRGDDRGWNPLLEGDDDLVVTVAETRLPGARDFEVVPVKHTFLMRDDTVLEHTLRFLQHGYLVAEDKRQPLKAEE